MLEVGTVIDGRFRIERILGQGGMGLVAIATHVQLDQRVAIKVMLDALSLDAEATERFLREARASVRLRSEHVCKVTDVGQLPSGAPYLVMELLEGSDLSAVLARGPLPIETAVDFVLQACVALAEAHAIGIVHRDLKPGNLFLTVRLDGSPLIKVLDFGIAKAPTSDVRLTRTATVMGSPGYMSPEQLRSAHDVDPRSDVWSLGVILYELVTGRLPFHGQSITELAVKVVMDPPAPLGDVPPAFAAVVMRCLEKSPELRYPSVAALAADLAPLGGERAWRDATLISTIGGGRGTAASPAASGSMGDAATLPTLGAGATGRPAAPAALAGTPSGAPTPRPPTAPVQPGATTLGNAAAQSTSGAPAAAPRRRGALVLGGLAVAAVAAVAAAAVVSQRDRGARPGPHDAAAVAAAVTDAGAAIVAVHHDDAAPHADPAASATDAGAGSGSGSGSGSGDQVETSELRTKLRELAARKDWFAVLEVGELDRDDPEIAAIVRDARAQYLGQQARAIDAQVKAGQCARAQALIAAAREVLPDDTTLAARAHGCRPRPSTTTPPTTTPPTTTPPTTTPPTTTPPTTTPRTPPTIDDAARALAAGDPGRALGIAEALIAANPANLAATRMAAFAACAVPDAAKAAHHAAALQGPDRVAARAQCRRFGVQLPEDGGAVERDDLADAQRALQRGQWDQALTLAQAALAHKPGSIPAASVAITAACHLRDIETAMQLIVQVPPPRARVLRRACAAAGVDLPGGLRGR